MRKIYLKGIKGGTGATAIVANLACALKKSNTNVIVLDLDPKNDLGLHLGLSWEHNTGWSNYNSLNAALAEFHCDSDGVIFLPFGSEPSRLNELQTVIRDCEQLKVDDNSWLLLDCPAHLDLDHFNLCADDIFLEVVNCDATCHSFIYKRLLKLNQQTNHWQHYFLVNRYNSASELEFDLLQLWQSEVPLLAPLYINKDEVISESTAFRNVAVNCAPYSVANDDFETLAGWLVSRATHND
ncbi:MULTISPECIES: cellulose biosynthesis protein BcsQ [Pseudoalteromonas]|uniref:Cellulose biosynthesis protein BcsQ n=1 Tax=Pseudoalteromonas haloplanktis TaxID=228 RepID=A0ABU1BB79_PSEHA|nr:MULTISPECIES: cellulose biosynthesis protein BcsQ [Pseudoalteromonas]MCF6143645.1 hypothetical protein [Pseudoalteromonas mariniglutinosa NCIMB 1770]MDQ9091179.1 cellulose biosynthesis protein BcsQ [Pseudoalteromonas haloplanktis]TMN71389.1 cellulose synthase operon protein YhjQ [Pseudoalteromonas sp. S1727]BDF93585.1 hypothetical protein KAN5_04230 [Pseudoalteromonas sp. KAN5]